ncbi:septation regulator SpoVG [bacterium]|nr:septation regulator SpoVG [bacterium]MBU1072724.1 septation regulator SpoVG [bacterium]MBU1676118.1 septation regulator SpoVG [bacterium]
MEITEIRITLRDDDKLRGFASVTLDNCFVVRGLKIIEGANGMFVAMPNRRRKDGTFQDIAHPINMKTREWMENQIITAYKQELQRAERGEVSVLSSDRDDDSALEERF